MTPKKSTRQKSRQRSAKSRLAAGPSSGTANTAPKPGWQAVFIEALSDNANVSKACRAARVSRALAYGARKTDAEFRKHWKDALRDAIESLEAETWRRARDGTEKPVYQGGQLVGTIQEYSDTLMIFLLKAHKPKRYRESVKHEHGGPGNTPIPVAVADMDKVRGKRWAAAAGALAAVLTSQTETGSAADGDAGSETGKRVNG